MANNRIEMTTIKQIIRLKAEGAKNKAIARNLNISRTTLIEYVKKLENTGLDWPSLQALDELTIHGLLAGDHEQRQRHQQLTSFFSYMDDELKRPGVTRQLLWQEYFAKYEHPYSYTQFCHYYQQYRKVKKATAPIIHKAGDKLMVDFTGEQLEIVDEDGQLIKVQVFVGILAASGLTFAIACLSQKQQDFLDCLERCLRYIGGVPAAIVTDNLKSSVVRGCKYEPDITQAMKRFALHYQTVILPTRTYKPKDKASVENAVTNVYRQVFAPIRNQQFFSLNDLNKSILQQIDLYNQKKFQQRNCSRIELFDKIEKAMLKPLPIERFKLVKQVRATVQKNCHIWLSEDKHYYSVPYRYIGQRVQIYYTSNDVEIYSNYSRVAIHIRNRKGYGYTTEKDHLSSTHKYVSELNPKMFIDWAADIGTHTQALIQKFFEVKPHPEQAYKSCQGILSLAKRVGKERLNRACERVLYYQNYNYKTVKSVLDQELDCKQISLFDYTSDPVGTHENIRGKDYYK